MIAHAAEMIEFHLETEKERNWKLKDVLGDIDPEIFHLFNPEYINKVVAEQIGILEARLEQLKQSQ